MTGNRLPSCDVLRVLASLLALLLISAPFTVGALQAFPIWDDAWLWLLMEEKGVVAVVASFSDRPVNAHLWALFATSPDAFWRAAFIAQALLWPAFGLISALLWISLFPRLRKYAFVVGCVTIAPFVTKVQMVTANIALASLLSVVLGYGALLLLLRFVKTADRVGWVAFVLSLPVLAAAVLIQEYALAVVVVMCVFLVASLWLTPDPATRRRAGAALLSLILVAGAAYVTYFLLADHEVRPNVHPLYMLTRGKPNLWLPFILVSTIWRGVVGGFAASLSVIQPTSKMGICGTVYGLLVAGLLVYGASGRQEDSAALGPAVRGRVCLLVVGLAAGLALMLVMGRLPWDPRDGMTSRYGLPVMPVTAALTVLCGITIVRQRFWVVSVMLFGVAAGYTTFTDVGAAVRERQAMAVVGATLQGQVSASGGSTVVVMPTSERTLGPQRQWELVARLTATWPPDLRKKFWAYRFGQGFPPHNKDEGGRNFGARGNCKRTTDIDTQVRLVTRKDRVDHLLWVAQQPDGSIAIEPYCIGEQRHAASTDDAESKKDPTTPAASSP